MTSRWLVESVYIREVFASTCRSFIANQTFTTNYRDRKAIDLSLHSRFPSLREGYPGDFGEHIDTTWWEAKLNDSSGFQKPGFEVRKIREPKLI